MDENIIAHNINTSRTKDVLIGENVDFQSMFLSPNTLEGLIKSGFQKPSPIQLKAIPLGRCGFDLIVKSKSGTGKTLVFSVVALEMIDLSSLDLQVLILAPTREIAVQIADTLRTIGNSFPGMKVNSFIGGLPEKDDREKAQNCQIAVGAPGRLKSLIKQNILNVTTVKLFVLDEADKLMEESFYDDVNEIYNNLSMKKQMITASATYPDNLQQFLSVYMQSPTYISAENDTQLLLGLKHFIREVEPTVNSAQEIKLKNVELLKLLASISFTQCIIFSNYQTRAENVSISINRHGWNSMFISAAQTQEKRLEAINKLKNFKCRILLSTDLTARGIDASNIDLVINYDVPIDVSTYLHRMGRAGRYGSKGICVTLVSGDKELLQMRKFLGSIGGTKLTISKLSDVENETNDLWASDESKFEKISGIIAENEDVTHTIKNEILSIKQSSSDESSAQTEKKKDYENMKNYFNKNSTSENTTSSDRKTKKSNDGSIKTQECDTTIVQVENSNKGNDSFVEDFHQNTCLQSLANGSFDFGTITTPKSSDSIEDDDSTNICLQSLANGTFDFDDIPSPKKFFGNINQFPKENDTIIKAITEIENQFMSSSSLENKDCLEVSTSVKSFESNFIVESLPANDNIKKKNEKTRKSSELEIENEGKICKNEVYIKNKGIYEVARILNSHTKLDSDAELNLNNFLNILEKNPKNNEIKPTDEGQNSPAVINDHKVVDNIFSLAYLHSIEIHKNGIHWKDSLKESQNQPDNQIRSVCNDLEDPMEEDYEEDDEDSEEDIDEGWEEEMLDEDDAMELNEDPEIEYDENGYINIPNRMVWVPVEENTSEKNKIALTINLLEEDETACENTVDETIINPPITIENESSVPPPKDAPQIPEDSYKKDHFSVCFNTCSRVLWNEGLKFNCTEDFDRWYYNGWLQDTKKIREYVRQNVYVKEMSDYQNKKKNV